MANELSHILSYGRQKSVSKIVYEVQARTTGFDYRIWDSVALCSNESRAAEHKKKWEDTYKKLGWPMEVRIINRMLY